MLLKCFEKIHLNFDAIKIIELYMLKSAEKCVKKCVKWCTEIQYQGPLEIQKGRCC